MKQNQTTKQAKNRKRSKNWFFFEVVSKAIIYIYSEREIRGLRLHYIVNFQLEARSFRDVSPYFSLKLLDKKLLIRFCETEFMFIALMQR